MCNHYVCCTPDADRVNCNWKIKIIKIILLNVGVIPPIASSGVGVNGTLKAWDCIVSRGQQEFINIDS